jgi:hypothetical protein
MFLENEHVIIMDQGGYELEPGELAQLARAGVKTVYYQAGCKWGEIQPNPTLPRDFAKLDRYLENVERAGLKCLLPFLNQLPGWLRDEYYFTRAQAGIPNYENPAMGAWLDDLACDLIMRYPPSIFQLIYGMPADGEFPCEFWPNSNTLPFPTRVLSDWVIDRHEILAAQHNEVWTAFHCYTQPVWFDEFYGALKAAYPDAQHYAIAFTHFIHNRQCQKDTLAHNRDAYGMRYFAGSEYVQGYRWSLPMLLAENVWGFITCPIHSFQEHRRIEPWMLSEIERVVKTLESRDA